MNDPYATLGVERDADADDIKRAYRQKAQSTHPDRQGGDADEFKEVASAYAVLSDPSRRAAYDRGDDDDPETPEEAARGVFRTMAANLINAGANLIVGMERNIAAQEQVLRRGIDAARDKKAHLLKRRSMVRTKGGAANLVHEVIDDKLRAMDRQIAEFSHALAVNLHLERMLREYEDDLRPPPSPSAASFLRAAWPASTKE